MVEKRIKHQFVGASSMDLGHDAPMHRLCVYSLPQKEQGFNAECENGLIMKKTNSKMVKL